MTPQFTATARKQLLEVARLALEAGIRGRDYVPRDVDPKLSRPCGAFVTVRRREGGELRACLGRVDGSTPLVETVALVAASAAAHDRRFDPVTLDELPLLTLEISVLGPMVEVQPEAVEVGVHGVLVRCGQRSGLLLPQVAVEHGFTREVFLEQACRKAGLGPQAWREAVDCEIYAFTATLVSEDD